MKLKSIPARVAGCLLFLAAFATEGRAQQSLPGGYSTAAVTNAEVVAAAVFAIQAEAKALRQKQDAQPVDLKLVKILSAQKQVVAGMNFRLKLKVTLGGKEKVAETVVWWQAWRTPDPYRLTAWDWK